MTVFRWVVRNWLRNAASRKIRETVTEAAREKLAGATGAANAEGPAAADRPCDVGVVFALGIEAGGLEDLVEGAVFSRGHGFSACQGGLKGRHVVLTQSGPGSQAAAHAAEALIAGHKPQWIISAGFAGGLDPSLKRHDLVMADSLADAGGNRLALDFKVDPAALARTPGVHVGRLVTVDGIVRLPDDKRALGEKHQALAVDMESYAVAEVCRRRQVRFLAVRVVGDAVDDELPADVERLLQQKTPTAKLGAVIGSMWNRPSSMKDLWKLKEDALVASDRLGKFLASTIEQLVVLPPTSE
ncbi:MAG: nucleoside phosphorylase [Planctomycetota bacterium]